MNGSEARVSKHDRVKPVQAHSHRRIQKVSELRKDLTAAAAEQWPRPPSMESKMHQRFVRATVAAACLLAFPILLGAQADPARTVKLVIESCGYASEYEGKTITSQFSGVSLQGKDLKFRVDVTVGDGTPSWTQYSAPLDFVDVAVTDGNKVVLRCQAGSKCVDVLWSATPHYPDKEDFALVGACTPAKAQELVAALKSLQ
jgi:hypothetical protein